MVLIGWLLLGVLLALLGALIIAIQVVQRGFADLQKELREVRRQFDTTIRLQGRSQRSMFSERGLPRMTGEDRLQ